MWAVPLGLALCFAGCSDSGEPDSTNAQDDLVLAIVGGEAITAGDLAAEANRLAAVGAPVPEAEHLLDGLVDRRAAVFRARSLGLDRDPEVVRRIENLLIGKLESSELTQVASSAGPTEEELRTAYEERIEEFATPARVRLALLRLGMPKAASPEKEAEIRAKMDLAREAALALPAEERFFGQLALRYADDPSLRARRGDARWFEEGVTGYRWPDEVIAAGFELPEIGVLSPVIEVKGDALYLVKRADYRARETRSLDSVRAFLTTELSNQSRQERQRAFAEANRSAAGVEWFRDRLDELPTAGPDAGVLAGRPQSEPPQLPR